MTDPAMTDMALLATPREVAALEVARADFDRALADLVAVGRALRVEVSLCAGALVVTRAWGVAPAVGGDGCRGVGRCAADRWRASLHAFESLSGLAARLRLVALLMVFARAEASGLVEAGDWPWFRDSYAGDAESARRSYNPSWEGT